MKNSIPLRTFAAIPSETFEEVANEAKDSDVKNFASKTLSTLKVHLPAAEEIQGKIGK